MGHISWLQPQSGIKRKQSVSITRHKSFETTDTKMDFLPLASVSVSTIDMIARRKWKTENKNKKPNCLSDKWTWNHFSIIIRMHWIGLLTYTNLIFTWDDCIWRMQSEKNPFLWKWLSATASSSEQLCDVAIFMD